uniref:Uncharacterized protein n=1 Tax=Lepeophtheirus salmonis TaxID=72036 RepID=A0A0K2UM30_LEPSM
MGRTSPRKSTCVFYGIFANLDVLGSCWKVICLLANWGSISHFLPSPKLVTFSTYFDRIKSGILAHRM